MFQLGMGLRSRADEGLLPAQSPATSLHSGAYAATMFQLGMGLHLQLMKEEVEQLQPWCRRPAPGTLSWTPMYPQHAPSGDLAGQHRPPRRPQPQAPWTVRCT